MTTLKPSSCTRLLAALFVALTLPLAAQAAPAAEVDDNILNYLQLLRSDFNSAKVELVNRIMKLSEADAKKFWPLYREYENELGRLSIQRAEFIAEFIKHHEAGVQGTPEGNDRAKDMARRWFKVQRARLDLLEKYHRKIQKALTPVQAGQFLQIEHQIGLFVDVTIASEMPIVGQKSP